MKTVEQIAQFLREGNIHYNTGYSVDCSCGGVIEHENNCIIIIESLEDAEKLNRFLYRSLDHAS